MEKVFLAGDSVTDMCVLRLPARGGDTGTDPEFAIWEEKGGVDLSRRTLESLSFKPEVYAVIPSDGERVAMAELMCLKSKDGKDVHDPAPDRRVETAQGCARVMRYDGYFTRPVTPPGEADQQGVQVATAEDLVDKDYDILFFNDAGNGIRQDLALANAVSDGSREKTKVLVHKMHHKLKLDTRLASAITKNKSPNKLLIISAFDLRLAEVRMRGHLSWDAALEDLGASLDDPESFLSRATKQYNHIVIVFGVDAVACVHGETRISFVYHPTSAEGDLFITRPGELYGQMNAFSCCLLSALTASLRALRPNEQQLLELAMEKALAGARAYSDGVITLPSWNKLHEPLEWPVVNLPKNGDASDAALNHKSSLRSVTFGLEELQSHRPGEFRLLALMPKSTLDLSTEIVRAGKSVLLGLPSARIGKFTTLDRSEIESYRMLQRLIDGYLSDTRITKPISIGVFGPPGSGKSFGIKQIAKLRNLPMLEFNLSEADADALPGYFHEVRDQYLEGRIPLCFFDEFDSRERALVARFLAPMQDGTFRDGPRVHPVGRAIFVFAGGTAQSAAEFLGAPLGSSSDETNGNASDEQENIRKKVPDFVSRLSATLDIMGPNPTNADGGSDAFYVRRAVLLRSMLEQHLPQIVAHGDSEAEISRDVISAFLTADSYLFGARSIEQVLRMCAVAASQTQLGVSDLPDSDKLSQHVSSPEAFLKEALRAD